MDIDVPVVSANVQFQNGAALWDTEASVYDVATGLIWVRSAAPVIHVDVDAPMLGRKIISTLVVPTVMVAGTIQATVSRTGLTRGFPAISVSNGDDGSAVAIKVRDAFLADSPVSNFFNVTAVGSTVVLIPKVKAGVDLAMNVEVFNNSATGLNPALFSVNTTVDGPNVNFQTYPSTVTGSANADVVLILTPNKARVLTDIVPIVLNNFKLQSTPPYASGTIIFNSDSNYRRWAVVMYNQQAWITNELNPVCFTDGMQMTRYRGDQPAGRYIETFFDHLIVGCPTFQGQVSLTKVMWSDLYGFNRWTPKQENEADSFDFIEWCNPDFPFVGITGLGKIGDRLFAYTPSSIVSCVYVGKPRVMKWETVAADTGNSLFWGLLKRKGVHYFFDGNEGEFYSFNGETLEPIGGKIKKYFVTSLNKDFDLAQKTYGYLVPENQEAHWVFVSSQSNGPFDQEIIYNWRSKAWFTASVNNTQCSVGPTISSKLASDLTGNADGLSGAASNLSKGAAVTLMGRIWGGVIGQIFRDEVSGDANNVLIAGDAPVLETKDYYYDDLEGVKELDTICIHAAYTGTDGIKVEIAVRDAVDDAVNYQDAGTWFAHLPEGRLSTPKISGRIFRWRFTPLGTAPRGFRWTAYVENVRRTVVEK